MTRVGALCIGIACASATLAQEPLSIKGIRQDAARSQVLAQVPEMHCDGDSCMLSISKTCGNYNVVPEEQRLACVARYSYGGITPNAWMASFHADTLTTLRVLFHDMHFKEIAAALIERFGKPDATRQDGRMLVWERSGATLIARVNAGTGSAESSVALLNGHALNQQKQEAERRKSDAAKERAKDL
jgi:hypothetical protein